MTAREDFDATTRQAWDTDVEAAMRRHPAGSAAPSESEMVFTTSDQAEFHRLFTADAQQHPALPPNWQAWAEQEPELSARHKLVALILLNTAALLVLLVVGRIVWQGISTVVGL